MEFGASIVNPLSAGLLTISGLMLLGVRRPRWVVGALIIMYLGVFGLVIGVWPSEQAVVKLIAGWMSTAILGATQVRLPEASAIEPIRSSGIMFRVLTGALIFLLAVSVAPEVDTWFPEVGFFHGYAGILLGGIGLFLIGFSERPIHISIALLVLFAGFETIYAALEDSTLVTAILSVFNIALVLVGSYLHLSGTMQEQEEAS